MPRFGKGIKTLRNGTLVGKKKPKMKKRNKNAKR
jgi:hypothetical protein